MQNVKGLCTNLYVEGFDESKNVYFFFVNIGENELNVSIVFNLPIVFLIFFG